MANSHISISVPQLSSVCENTLQKHSLFVGGISDASLWQKYQQLSFLNTGFTVYAEQDIHSI